MAVRFNSDSDWISRSYNIGGAGHVNFTIGGWFYLEEFNDSAGILAVGHSGNGRTLGLSCDNNFPTARVSLGDSQTGFSSGNFATQPSLNTWIYLELSSPNTTGGTVTARWSELGSSTVRSITRTNGVEASVQAEVINVNRFQVGDANGFTGGMRAAMVRAYSGPTTSDADFLTHKAQTSGTGTLFFWPLADNTDTSDTSGNSRTPTFNGTLTTESSPSLGGGTTDGAPGSAAGAATASSLAGSSTAASARTAAAGTATASTVAGTSTAVSAITGASGAATAGSLAGAAVTAAAITQASGAATASSLAASSTAAAATTAANGAGTASTAAGSSTAASAITQANGAATAGTLSGEAGAASITPASGTATTGTLASTVTAVASIVPASGTATAATLATPVAASETMYWGLRRKKQPAPEPEIIVLPEPETLEALESPPTAMAVALNNALKRKRVTAGERRRREDEDDEEVLTLLAHF